jgi:hypothetical protein
MSKIKVEDILNRDGFLGIILSNDLVKKLNISEHPFLKISIGNEIVSVGEKIDIKMAGCVTHEDGWGFVSLANKNRE